MGAGVGSSSSRSPYPPFGWGCGVVVLAAGAGQRMGRPKQLLPWQGKPLLLHQLEQAFHARPEVVSVVLGAHAELCRPLVAPYPVLLIDHAGWAAGMGSSIARGVGETLRLRPHLRRIVLLPVDMPFVTSELLRQIMMLGAETGQPVACRYESGFGPPTLFPQPFFEALQGLKGKAGARALLKPHLEQVQWVDFPLGHLDLDTPEDYRRGLDMLPPQIP